MQKIGLRRVMLSVVGAAVLVSAGGALWLVFRPMVAPASGTVLGVEATPAFWREGTLLLSSTRPQHLLYRSKDGTVHPAPLDENLDIRKAVVTAKNESLLLVTQQGSQQALWRYDEGVQPKLLAATSGDIVDVALAPTQPYLAFRERRTHEIGFRLSLIHTQSGAMTSVTSNAESVAWLEQPAGIVSVDSHNQVWLHTLQLTGKVDPPQLLGASYSTVAVRQDQGLVYFVGDGEETKALKVLRLVSKEERLLAPFPDFTEVRRVQLTISEDGATLAAALPSDASQENGQLVVVETATGSITTLTAIGKNIKWLGSDTLLYERVAASMPQVWMYSLRAKTTQPFAEQQSFFSS